MSKFRVKLNNSKQGKLDINSGAETNIDSLSLQRTIFVPGPRGIRRQLKDGDEFEDSNYWKQFAYPQVSKEEAFIEVVEDDGSIYSQITEENNFPRVYTVSVLDGSSYENNTINIVEDNGGFAKFVQIYNFDSGGAIKVKLNGLNNAIFDLEKGAIQQFNNGDISISKLQFHNDSGENSNVQVILSVVSVSKS